MVLEFPTIYALKYPPEKLPTGLITEDDYYKTQMKDGDINIETNIKKLDELMRVKVELLTPNVRQVGGEESEQLASYIHDGAEINGEEEERVIGMDLNLDSEVLMDVLARDFGGWWLGMYIELSIKASLFPQQSSFLSLLHIAIRRLELTQR